MLLFIVFLVAIHAVIVSHNAAFSIMFYLQICDFEIFLNMWYVYIFLFERKALSLNRFLIVPLKLYSENTLCAISFGLTPSLLLFGSKKTSNYFVFLLHVV